MSKSASQRVQRNATNTATTQNNQGITNTNAAGADLTNAANTGLITPGMVQSSGQAVQGNIASIYDAAKQNAVRRQRIQGGYNPGAGANAAALSRGASASTSSAVNQNNLGLSQLQSQNQLSAMSGLSNLGLGQYNTGANNTRTAEMAAAAQPGFMNQLSQGIGDVTQIQKMFTPDNN